MIDTTTGAAAMAYVGRTPWHGLGAQLQPGASIEEWTAAARLGYTVLESPVLYESPASTELQRWPLRKVLHRSDTGAPLAVVSDGYRVVQPAEVMDFFRRLGELGGFELETAGALSDGRRVWALARVSDGADVVDGDTVRPYLLFGTSYDGTMATVAKFTDIRVVCNNTVVRALGEGNGSVRVLHSERFDADEVRLQLGIVASSWERFLVQSRALAGVPMSGTEADEFVKALLEPYHSGRLEIQDTRAYKRVLQLFNGAAIGADIPGVAGTRWAMLNAVTQLVDHERGRSDSTRLESAWFGTGAAMKQRAVDLLAEGV
jgi:phage/plasmid-like protein (TIGR03299 family)